MKWKAPPVASAGALLGCGLGALLDGIVLHEILQWHNLLSNVTPPTDLVTTKYNMLWDGVFHLVAWLVTALGVAQLWRATQRWGQRAGGTRAMVGSVLMGWGAFNLIEGVIDHHLLELHHVRPGPGELGWDVGFLLSGVLLVAIGARLLARDRHDSPVTSEAHGHR